MRHIKRVLCLCFLLLLAGCAALSPEPEDESALLPWPSEQVTIWISSDLHWQDSSGSYRTPYLDEIIDTLLTQSARAEPQALILCGDLTNSGHIEEHQAVAARLKEAQERGLNIFVTMGNHDVDYADIPKILTEIYAPFGWEQAISRDENSMSYLAPLTDELWLLSLDSNQYGDRGDGVGGIITEETLSWVADCLEMARETGAMVVPFGHHNLIAQDPTENNRGFYNIEGRDKLLELFLDFGVPMYFSGHQHTSSINLAERKTRQLVESVVPTPTTCPYFCTAVTFEPDGTVKHYYKTLDVEAWARRAGRDEPEFLQFTAKNQERARMQWRALAVEMAESMDIPTADIAAMANFFRDFMTQYHNHHLWQEGKRLRNDPAFALWLSYAPENNYVRWIRLVLENGTNDAPEQTFGPFHNKMM